MTILFPPPIPDTSLLNKPAGGCNTRSQVSTPRGGTGSGTTRRLYALSMGALYGARPNASFAAVDPRHDDLEASRRSLDMPHPSQKVRARIRIRKSTVFVPLSAKQRISRNAAPILDGSGC